MGLRERLGGGEREVVERSVMQETRRRSRREESGVVGHRVHCGPMGGEGWGPVSRRCRRRREARRARWMMGELGGMLRQRGWPGKGLGDET